MDWTEAHRPRSLDDVVGNGPAVARLKEWGRQWRDGTPEARALILSGPPGTGKTSAALALAADMGWTAIELNASDARNAERIRKVATAGAVHRSFSSGGEFLGADGGHTLIVLDEADNLYERPSGESAAGGGAEFSDRGGKTQIIETIRQTRQPIILIVNDLYALQRGSGASLKSLAETVKFNRINVRSIPKALQEICRREGIQVDREVLEAIAVKAGGDLRAAVRDLESICTGRTRVAVGELESLGLRDTTGNLFDLVRHVLKGRKLEDVRREVWDVEATPEDLVLWIDENIPKEYKDPEDLARAYDALGRADVFLGRTRRTQNYGLWSYAGEMATLGVMTARRHEYKGFTPIGFPQWLSKMSRSRGMRQTKQALAAALAGHTHQSARKARLHQVEAVQHLFAADRGFAVAMTHRLDLLDDHVAILLDTKASDKDVKAIRSAVDELREQEEEGRDAGRPPGGLGGFDDDEAQAGRPAGPDDGDEAPKRPDPASGQKTLF